jgi:hypothetical protein
MKIVFNITDTVNLPALISQSMPGVFADPGDTITLVFIKADPAPVPIVETAAVDLTGADNATVSATGA